MPYLSELPCLSKGESPTPLDPLHANRREGWVPYLSELPCLSGICAHSGARIELSRSDAKPDYAERAPLHQPNPAQCRN